MVLKKKEHTSVESLVRAQHGWDKSHVIWSRPVHSECRAKVRLAVYKEPVKSRLQTGIMSLKCVTARV